MPEVLTITLARPVAAVRAISASDGKPVAMAESGSGRESSIAEQVEAAARIERTRLTEELEQQKAHLDQLCRTVGSLVGSLQEFQQETVAGHREEIAKLAVEIARKILMHQIAKGDYDIQAVVVEALKRAPTRQNIVIRVNPEDLAQCQRLQQDDPDGPLAALVFTADWSIGRSECLVETPKGIVKSFVEEHLEHITEALEKVE